MIELPERLSSVFSLIPGESQRVIDVGSDHGKMALACLQSGIVSRVVCTDIHKEPAERTRRCLADYDYTSKSEVYCTDGLKGVTLLDGDAVVIAGMGGNTIIDIMTAAIKDTDKDVLKNVYWCLQPQKTFEKVREFLAGMGFCIVDEKVCLDRDIYYQIILARYDGDVYTITDKEAFYGPRLLEHSSTDNLVKDFYNHLNGVLKVRARGDERIRRMLEEES